MKALFCGCGSYVQVNPGNGWLIPHACSKQKVPPLLAGEQAVIDAAWDKAERQIPVDPTVLILILERIAGIRDVDYKSIDNEEKTYEDESRE